MSKEVIRVFVGCDPNNCDLEQMMVLEYSMRKHTTSPLEIIWMQLSSDSSSFWYSDPENNKGWNTTLWVTPFSGFRWSIPAYCGYEGRAIYMDADMIVLSDIKNLWDHPFNENSIMVSKGGDQAHRTCVMLWDCAKAKNKLPKLNKIKSKEKSHKRLGKKLQKNPLLITPFNDNYNSLDGENLAIEEIKILHFTDIDTQFSHKYSIPRLKKEGSKHWYEGEVNEHWRKDLITLFDRYYKEALSEGYSLENYRNIGFGSIDKKDMTDYVGSRHLLAKDQSCVKPIKKDARFASKLKKFLKIN
ncbi:glycosyltransferase [Ignatzschineria sp. LJL83]